ncbi:hypothetical protein [Eleftheria terrae]|uniref:hypothetical protein n=1 Tax=Eleftheria terrae TaxID=1597781 RepID=UPI00263B5B04|nr:hypothetical protein [Eleftheria terrae]WKB50584.1 hypothetical protein N7L95_12070 [Eleftheria terrae]
MKHRALIFASAGALALGGLLTWSLRGDGTTVAGGQPPAAAGGTSAPGAAAVSLAAASAAQPAGALPPAGTPAVPGAKVDPAKVLVGNNTEYPTLATRLTEMAARRDGNSIDPAEALAAMQQPAAWQDDPSVAAQLPLSNEERTDGRSFMRFNPLKLETLMPGDTLDIPIKQANATYRMVVESVESHGDGSVTWTGKLRDFPQQNQVTLTQALGGGDRKGLTHGGVTTPDESYVLQVYDNVGWMATSASLFKIRGDEHDLRGGRHPMGPNHNPATDPPVLR